jgi:hypothetical protein
MTISSEYTEVITTWVFYINYLDHTHGTSHKKAKDYLRRLGICTFLKHLTIIDNIWKD